jgi:CysZ protein
LGTLVVPIFNSAYLNQRLFRYDALAEHATRDEYRLLVTRMKWPLYGLGVLLAALYYVPFVNLVAPVFSGLAFTHFCLRELERMRRST